MKKAVYTILILLLTLSLCGYTLKGGVTFTVEQARKEAFADVQYRLPQSIINAHLKDPNYKENMKAKGKGIIDLGDRLVTYFSDGGYGVLYKRNQYYEYYYYANGKLEMIGKRTSTSYPAKSYKYDTDGKLQSVILYAKKGESYNFTATGRLNGIWHNNKCYDINGKLLLENY